MEYMTVSLTLKPRARASIPEFPSFYSLLVTLELSLSLFLFVCDVSDSPLSQ